jgi:pimeloyl-ACP methyl ester carboxylesterase
MPVLFVNGEFDVLCSVTGNRQGDPLRAACLDLREVNVPAGHWLPLERPDEHIAEIRDWLRRSGF